MVDGGVPGAKKIPPGVGFNQLLGLPPQNKAMFTEVAPQDYRDLRLSGWNLSVLQTLECP